MSSLLRRLRPWLLVMPDPRGFVRLLRIPAFLLEWWRYAALTSERVVAADLYPCLGDRTTSTPFDPHYFFQAAWLARRLPAKTLERHVDVASSVQMVGVISGFVPTVFVDYRPLQANLPKLLSVAGTLTGLPFGDRSLPSLSCLHVIEHVGLGRYGDPVDPAGSVRALKELQRVLAVGGTLYLSLPVGRERVCFNAHRVHAPLSICTILDELELVSFSLIDDAGLYRENAATTDADGLDYGCGLFEFRRADQVSMDLAT